MDFVGVDVKGKERKTLPPIKSTGDPAAGFAVLRRFRIGAGMRSSDFVVVCAARVHFRRCQVDSYSLRGTAIFSVPFHFKPEIWIKFFDLLLDSSHSLIIYKGDREFF